MEIEGFNGPKEKHGRRNDQYSGSGSRDRRREQQQFRADITP